MAGYDNAIVASSRDETRYTLVVLLFTISFTNSGGHVLLADVIGIEGGSAPNADYLHADKHIGFGRILLMQIRETPWG